MKKRLFVFVVVLLTVGFAFNGIAVEWVEPPDYTVAGVIGASYENAQAPPYFPPAPNGWYNGGYYKTWVDYIAGYHVEDFHWLNYAKAGDVSANGMFYLNELFANTLFPDASGQPVTTVNVLVIGFWGNDFVWLPGYDQGVMDALIQNVSAQIAAAKNAGVEKIIVTGWTDYNDMDLDYFISLFPELTTHIDEAGYNQAKEYYYNAFSGPNPDYIFVEPWCRFTTFDGVHPAADTSKKAALIIMHAVKHYDQLVNKKSLFCH